MTRIPNVLAIWFSSYDFIQDRPLKVDCPLSLGRTIKWPSTLSLSTLIMNETYRFWWNLLNCYPENARITISLTLYQTVRHKQVQIKYGFFIHRDNFSFAKRVQWLFIDDLTFEGHFMLTYCNSLKWIEIHWFSDKLNTSYEVNWGQIQNEPFHTTTNTASNHLTVGVRVLG